MHTACSVRSRRAAAAFLAVFLTGAAAAEPPAPAAAPAPVVIDGRFDDWAGDDVCRATDPKGDADGAFDVTRAWAASRGTTVYLRFDTGAELNLQSGPSSHGTLVWHFETPGRAKLSVDLREKNVFIQGAPENAVGHAPVRYMSAPTHSADEFELQLDLALIGASMGDEVTIRATGSDEVGPFTCTLEHPPAAVDRIAFSKDRPAGVLRVAALNVLHGGLTERGRHDRLGRLLGAANADVYLFQEQWDTEAPAIVRAMNELVPLSGGASWNVVASGHGTAIASRLPLEAVEGAQGGERATMGVVRTSIGPVGVASIHLKCCGYAGSSEDETRILTMRTLRAFIEERFGGDGAPPLIIGGDWNLVGSPTPLTLAGPDEGDVLSITPGPTVGAGGHEHEAGELIAVELRHIDNMHAHTWRSDRSDFAPGRLDFITFSSPDWSLWPVGGAVVDTAGLTPGERRALGVEARDSEVSDHLMLVTDFKLGAGEEALR